jgi:hypothetical protein
VLFARLTLTARGRSGYAVGRPLMHKSAISFFILPASLTCASMMPSAGDEPLDRGYGRVHLS